MKGDINEKEPKVFGLVILKTDDGPVGLKCVSKLMMNVNKSCW
jgi:hypothetical protein